MATDRWTVRRTGITVIAGQRYTQGVNTGLLRDHAVECWIALLMVVNLNGGENCS